MVLIKTIKAFILFFKLIAPCPTTGASQKNLYLLICYLCTDGTHRTEVLGIQSIVL
jgi:hypothetical protein